METGLVEDELPVGDPRLPGEIRAHAAGFRRKPVAYVARVENEYVLIARDGEVLDITTLRN